MKAFLFWYSKYMSDVIIVLGRGIEDDGSLPPDPKARVGKATELYKDGVAPFVIMSGAWTYHFDIHPNRSESKAMKEYAVELGIPEYALIEESKSMDTIGNVYFTKKDIIEQRGFKDIVVVASDDHMPRVKYLFEKIYGEAYNLKFVISERVIDDVSYEKEMAHESNSMAITHQWLDSFKPGDDASVWKLMTTRHPAYMPRDLDYEKNIEKGEDLYPDAP